MNNPHITPLVDKLKHYQEAEFQAAYNGDMDKAQRFYNIWIGIQERINNGEVWEVNF